MASVKSCPDFAVVCSFLERYGEHLQLPEVSIVDLETAIGYAHCVPPLLKDIIIKLMRKTRKSFVLEKWQRYLAKMCRERFSEVAAWEVERFGFAASKPQIKIAVLRFLCESQFDDNMKFKAIVNDEDPEKMRVEPMGRDKMGLVYWFQKDDETNIRIYREEQDDPDSSTWEVISSDRDQMENLITALKNGTNIVAGQGKDDDSESLSSDNSSSKTEIKKDITQDQVSSEAKKETSETDVQNETGELGNKTDIENNEERDMPPDVKGEKLVDESEGREVKTEAQTIQAQTDNKEKEGKDRDNEEQDTEPTDIKPKMEDQSDAQERNDNDVKPQVKQETPEIKKDNSLENTSPDEKMKEVLKEDSKEVLNETLKKQSDDKTSNEKGDEDDSGDKDGKDDDQDNSKGSNEQVSSTEDSQRGTDTPAVSIDQDDDKGSVEAGEKEKDTENDAAESKDNGEVQGAGSDGENSKPPLTKPKKVQKKRKKKSAKSRFTPRRNAYKKAAVKIEEEMKEEVEEEEEEEKEDDEVVENDDSPCCKCGQYNHPEWILLCDKCDSGYHTACLRPPLMIIPDGNWYCPNCEHEKLIIRLLETLTDVDGCLKKKERKRKRRDGEGLWALTDICARNILPGEIVKVKKQRHSVALRHTSSFRRKKQKSSSDDIPRSRHRQRHRRSVRSRRQYSRDRENYRRRSLRDRSFINDNEDEENELEEEFEMVQRRSCRTKKEISYKFEDFDTAINSAIQEEVVEHKKAVKEYQASHPVSRGKDISTIEGMKEISEDDSKDEATRRKVKRRLGDLDATSEEEEGSEDFNVDSDAASDQDYEEEEGDEEVEEDSYVSEDSDSDGPSWRKKRSSKWNSLPKRRSERRRKRVRYRDLSEDEEFQSESDAYSEYSDESDMKTRRKWSGRRQRDIDESEDSSYQSDKSGSKKRKPTRKRQIESDSESSENTGYVRKRKFRLESDNEDDDDVDDEKDEESKTKAVASSSSEDAEESGPVVRKKLAPVQRNKTKKYTEDSDYSPVESGRKTSRCSTKRIDYRKMAAESDSDEEIEDNSEEEANDGDSEDENKSDEEMDHKKTDSKAETNNLLQVKQLNNENEKPPSSQDGQVTESFKKSDEFAAKSVVSPLVSNSTTLNGGGTAINTNGSSGNVEGEDDDEDLLGVTDLVEFVTQDV